MDLESESQGLALVSCSDLHELLSPSVYNEQVDRVSGDQVASELCLSCPVSTTC